MKPGLILGNYPDLALLELSSLLGRLSLNLTVKPLLPALVELDSQINPALLLPYLGGSVKAGMIWTGSAENLTPMLLKSILTHHQQQVCFTGHLSQLNLNSLARSLKSQITPFQPFRFRFQPKITQTAGIGAQWADYTFFSMSPDQLAVFHTHGVQDIHWWSLKDSQRPAVNPRIGLLPPKIARMMVNLACHQTPCSQVSFLDPFCGSGTLGIEALDLGVSQLTLTDIDPGQIKRARANLTWFSQLKPGLGQTIMTVKDVMTYPRRSPLHPFSAIAFEGHLGPPSLSPLHFPHQAKGLVKFYTGVFKRLFYHLKLNGRLVAALPAYQLDSTNCLKLSPLIDTCEKLGYTLIAPPLIVGRPHAQIKREVYIFEKTQEST